jgi:hypothetical protein
MVLSKLLLEKLKKWGKNFKYLYDFIFDAYDEYDKIFTHLVSKLMKMCIKQEWVPLRYQGEFIEGPIDQVEYIDLVPNQIVGASASLIPFVDHDDATRALMGSHMQTQAVPLITQKILLSVLVWKAVVATALNRTQLLPIIPVKLLMLMPRKN